MAEVHRNSDETIKSINAAYDKAIVDINEDIDRIFSKFKIDSGLSDIEVRALLNSTIPSSELDEIRSRINRIKDGDIKRNLLARINAGAYRARITRLEALKESIYISSKQIADAELYLSTQGYINTITSSYYRNIYDIQKGTGLGFSFASMSVGTVEQLLKNNWSGKHYSKRIWDNTDVLAGKLEEVITSGLMQGKGSRKMAAEIEDMSAYGKFAAERLIRTETTYFTNESEQKAYEECDIEKYVFVATLDMRTSSQCRARDRKVYKVSERQPWVNCPPLHAFCRSTTIAYFGKSTMESLTRRARDPLTGQTYVIKNINYKDWYQKNVVEKYGPQKAEIIQNMINNKVSDKAQYIKYKDELGNEAPGSFDKFRELKYNDIKAWEDIKGFYRYKLNNPDSDKIYYEINKKIEELRNNGSVRIKGVAVKPNPILIKELNDHTLKRMAEREITKEDAQSFIDKSIVAFKQRKGTQHAYYSEKGFTAITTTGKVLSTGLLDEKGKIIVKEVKKILWTKE